MQINRRGPVHFPVALLATLAAACGSAPPATPASGPAPAPARPPAAAAPTEQPGTLADADASQLTGGSCADSDALSMAELEDGGAGYLDPRVVQNVVQGGYFSMRECYEEGLARDTELSGKIQVRFIIDHDGRVSSAQLDDNTLPDCEAARCMLEVYRRLEFPEPNGGRVTVVYPLTFTPG